MEHIEAIDFIKPAIKPSAIGHWLDLGCGSGTFTYALAELLGDGSAITALDLNYHKLKPLFGGCSIQFIQSNFDKDPLPNGLMDGILAANALHYIPHKESLITRIRNSLKPGGRFVLIEYDTEHSNQWVPYPLSFSKAKNLFLSSGFKTISKINERQSVYRNDLMYCCLIS